MKLHFTEKDMRRNMDRKASVGGLSIMEVLVSQIKNKMDLMKFVKKENENNNSEFKFLKASESKDKALKK